MRVQCTMCDCWNAIKVDNRLTVTCTKQAEQTHACVGCGKTIYLMVTVN